MCVIRGSKDCEYVEERLKRYLYKTDGKFKIALVESAHVRSVRTAMNVSLTIINQLSGSDRTKHIFNVQTQYRTRA